MWDELAAAAWIDPTLITKTANRYMSVDVDHGAGVWKHTDVGREETTRSFVGAQLGGNPDGFGSGTI